MTQLVPLTATRRTVLAAAVLSPLTWGAVRRPAQASAAYVVKGEIARAYVSAGGSRTLGAPLANEVMVSLDGHHTYGQWFTRGQVWWGSGVGKVDLPAGARVRLDHAKNFRPVTGVRDVYRSDDPDASTALEERILLDLGIATVIAMNSGTDPRWPGVTNVSAYISNEGSHLTFYRGYVGRAASRAAVGRVMTTIARSTAPVLLHCTAGKDRTGWTSDLLAAVAGVPRSTRDADYLATRRYSGGAVDLDWLTAARTELSRRYTSVDRYLTAGCGLSQATLTALRARVLPSR